MLDDYFIVASFYFFIDVRRIPWVEGKPVAKEKAPVAEEKGPVAAQN